MKIKNIGAETVQKKCLNPILFRDVFARGQGDVNLHAFSMWERRGVIYKKSGNQEMGLLE